LALSIVCLGSCSVGPEAQAIPSQRWKDVEVRFDTRPSPPHAGMTEVLLIITGAHGIPAHDLIVSLRSSDRDEWKQTIQDGQIGVYRRAVEVRAGERSVVQVQLQRGAEQGILYFPLKLID
jgi:hypothetical protein